MRTLSKNSGKRAENANVQMAPMIDMVFLLLVFFMCVSSISQAGLRVEVDLAESEKSEVPDDLSNRVAVSVNADKQVFLNAEMIDEMELKEALSRIASESAETKLIIRADESVPYVEIKGIMSSAAAVGIVEIVYATHQR